MSEKDDQPEDSEPAIAVTNEDPDGMLADTELDIVVGGNALDVKKVGPGR
jgi:hypothetical protein